LLGTIGYIVYYANNIDGTMQTESKPGFVSTIGKNEGQLPGDISEKQKFSVATCFYKSLQLFYLNAGAEPEKMNVSLEISRFTGALFSFNMILAGGIGLFRSYANRLLIRFYENHHIVFGYGGPGREIVEALEAKGEFAVVIADALSEEESEHLDHLGIPWIKRNPVECYTDIMAIKDIEKCLSSKKVKNGFFDYIINFIDLELKQSVKDVVNCFNDASAETASSFYLVFDNENINLKLMQQIMRTELSNSRELKIYCRSQEPLQFAEFCGAPKPSVSCNRLDPSLSAVRRHLKDNPIDIYRSQSTPPSGTRSRIVIIGWHDTISRPLLLQSVLLGQTDKSETKPVIDIIDPNASKIRAQILFRYPNLKECADINALPYHPESPEIIDFLKSIGSEFVASIFINSPCGDAATMNAKKIIKKCLDNYDNLQDFKVFQVLTEFDPKDETPEDKGATLKSDSYWNEIQLLESDVDSIAMYFFQKYKETYNKKYGNNDIIENFLKFDLTWDIMPEKQRARWRQRADGWEVKARALGGCVVGTKCNDAIPIDITNNETIRLAAMLDLAQHRASLAFTDDDANCNINIEMRPIIAKEIIEIMKENLNKFQDNEIVNPVYYIKRNSPA